MISKCFNFYNELTCPFVIIDYIRGSSLIFKMLTLDVLVSLVVKSFGVLKLDLPVFSEG
jgi:hypothetical protein